MCGLLDSIKGKLDDQGGSDMGGFAGQIMGYINDPAAGCELDTATPGRLTYFYFEPGQYFKYIRPIRRK